MFQQTKGTDVESHVYYDIQKRNKRSAFTATDSGTKVEKTHIAFFETLWNLMERYSSSIEHHWKDDRDEN